jgi:uncharacterized protein (TIGR03437 family)
VTTLRVLFLTAAIVRTGLAANLAVSTYFKDGFTPTAIVSDAQGNVLIAGSAAIDAAAGTTGVAVAKLDPKASRYLYLTYLDSAASDQVSAIAVDGAGNAYIAGSTNNPNFPVVGEGLGGTPPASSQDVRSFLTKLNPEGAVMYSVLIGGSVQSRALGVAITAQGQVLVSGIAVGSGFPATPGAYRVADSNGHWFLMELDAAASKVIFSATGIGGSSIAFDAAGNIYLAGSSPGTDYPTTPGAYQTAFVQGHICYGLCQIGFDGVLQHVSKVDPTGAKLIYSTGLNDIKGGAGNTTNTGLAVDAAGNAYVTGTLFEAVYPFTVPVPAGYSGYLTKLDATGSTVLFSVPIGGGGVQLDSGGAVYVGGVVSSYDPRPDFSVTPVAPPAPMGWVPQLCWPNNIVATSEAYVMKLDSATGNVQDAQWIDGSGPGAVGITLAGGKVWITGAASAPDVPFTPGVLSPGNLGTGFVPGAYLAAVDFSASAAAAPRIACVLDSGNLTHVRAVAAFQLISLFGANLGPATGVAAPHGGDPSINGVSVTFDGNPAQLLYVSSSQINVAVPAPPPSREETARATSTVMQVTVNGVGIQRQFPFVISNLNLFASLASNQVACSPEYGFQPVAANADGSLNSCANPARYGSTVSFFVHGVGALQYGFPPPAQLFGLQAMVGQCSAAVENAALVNGFVYQVDVRLPGPLLPCATSYSLLSAENSSPVTLSYNSAPVGPLTVPSGGAGPIVNFAPGQPMPMIVWVTK